eukprot:scaffold137225_cov15-Tisochrysis_lutea.AAC.1
MEACCQKPTRSIMTSLLPSSEGGTSVSLIDEEKVSQVGSEFMPHCTSQFRVRRTLNWTYLSSSTTSFCAGGA